MMFKINLKSDSYLLVMIILGLIELQRKLQGAMLCRGLFNEKLTFLTYHKGTHLRTVAWIFHTPCAELSNVMCSTEGISTRTVVVKETLETMRGCQTQNINSEGSLSSGSWLVSEPQPGLWLAGQSGITNNCCFKASHSASETGPRPRSLQQT